MTSITATVEWNRCGADFRDNRYSRAHTWRFDGGIEVPASSSPHVVPLPMSDPAAVDPEEAFVASLSSCHMLWFLSIAAKEGLSVEKYVDHACGEMGKNADGKLAMTVVTLSPKIEWSTGSQPAGSHVTDLHERAHDQCFIANSVKTEVRIQSDVECDEPGRDGPD